MYSDIFIGILITLAAAAVTVWKGFDFLKRYRLIVGTPTARIRSAHQGYVELKGHIAETNQPEITAPLSGRPCVWYEFRVEKLHGSGKNKRWRVERSGQSEEWFTLQDETGICLIDPAGAKIRTENTRTWYGDTPDPLNRLQTTDSGFSIAKALMTDLTIDSRRYRYKESLLFAYEPLYALGHFQSLGGGRNLPPLKDVKGEVIREWKQSYDQLLDRFDKDNNRQLDMQEWNDVQKAAAKEAQSRRKEMASAPTQHVLTCPESPRSQPFLLSTYDEEKLAQRYGWYALGCLAAMLLEAYILFHLLTLNQT